MAKRRSKQHAGAKQDAPPFDYSEAEWSEIEAAAQAVLPDGEPLPNDVRKYLVRVARDYQADIRMQPWSKERRDWQKVARLSERLYQALKAARPLARIEKPEETPIGRWIEAWFKRLLHLKHLAESIYLPSEDADWRPARVRYQSDVLEVWASLGGQLRFSRSKRGPQGPLIRFFRAVTSPVMGASAPSPESIADFVRRQKRFLLAEAEKAALQKANGDSQ